MQTQRVVLNGCIHSCPSMSTQTTCFVYTGSSPHNTLLVYDFDITHQWTITGSSLHNTTSVPLVVHILWLIAGSSLQNTLLVPLVVWLPYFIRARAIKVGTVHQAGPRPAFLHLQYVKVGRTSFLTWAWQMEKTSERKGEVLCIVQRVVSYLVPYM